MDTAENTKMPILPAWHHNSTGDLSELLSLALIVGLLIGIILLIARRFRGLQSGETEKNKTTIINRNPQNRLSADPHAPILKVGDTITLKFPTATPPLTSQILQAGETEFTILVPAGRDLPHQELPGAAVSINIAIGRNTYCVPATIARYENGHFTTCVIHHAETITFSFLERTHGLRSDLPTLFAVIPNSAIIADTIPFADLHNRLFPEIPGKIVSMHFNDAVVRTQSPLTFHQGDLILTQAMLPDNSAEINLWGYIRAIEPHRESNGQDLTVDLLTIDENLNRFLSGLGRKPLLDDTVVK